MPYPERTYRRRIANNSLLSYTVAVRETDLLIRSDIDLREPALASVHRHRAPLEAYIAGRPAFLNALSPLEPDPMAPDIVRNMIDASRLAGVGPMAAVAGAIAERVGKDLLSLTDNVIVENGGDLFLKCSREIKIGVFAGSSTLSDRLSILVRPAEMPLGVCTSSATVGPSLSFGAADAVCVKSGSASLADAAATAIANRVKTKKDIKRALTFGAGIRGVNGILIIIGDEMGVWGEMALA